ncbi:MAG TPA: acetate--CoA ligase family protein, partial [Acidobacteriota bacterium]|nr:acetate--CoA ligase family protein [Acidobacteriota bacterium]
IRGLVVITAGFREVNEQGAALERELAERIHRYGMRMIGPNCMGIINTDPEIQLNATFAPEQPVRGKIGFISQSGALGVTILSLSRERNLGFSQFASIGNKTNLSSNDLLEYWENAKDTEMVLMYLENFGNPRRFTQIARRFTQKKPILAVKSGRTMAGARAATSHTGAIAGQDIATDAILEQCGVLRAATIEEVFDYATALSIAPYPQGDRMAVLTNAGGPGIMATDSLINLGLRLAELSDGTRAALRQVIPPESNPNNPLDLLAGATPHDYRKALEILLSDPNVDGLLLINVPPIMVDPVEVAVSVSEVAQRFAKPVLGCFMGVKDILRTIQQTAQSIIPLYPFPESAARAMLGMVRYAAIRKRTAEEPTVYKVDRDQAAKILAKAAQENRSTLSSVELASLLSAYGIPSPTVREAKNLNEVIQQASAIGYPIVLKANLEGHTHKSDFGGVALDLRNDVDVTNAFQRMQERIDKMGLSKVRRTFYLQPMLRGGKEVILGMTYDATFGPLMMFGMGGIYVEVIHDTVLRAIPITPRDAHAMISTIKAFPVLQGVRGEEPVDLETLAEMLQRLSQLCMDFHQIRELEINPFLASPKRESCLALDARITFSKQ